MMKFQLFKVTENVSTTDDVTGTPIAPEFTGTPIKQVVGVYRTREIANMAAEIKSLRAGAAFSYSVAPVEL